MADKDLKLILKVDSASGQAKVEKLAATLKGLKTTSLSKDVAASSDKMKEMARNTAKAAEEYRKIADVSKRDSERLQKRINLEKQRAAVINRAHGEAINMERKRAAAIDKVNRKTKEQVKTIGGIKQRLFALRSYWLAISAAVSIVAITVVKGFKAMFNSVERFRLSVASVAASITTFSDISEGNVAEVYNNAYKYAEKLALKMEVINARTIATGEQLRAMNETFIQQGVLLDVNNKKQEDAFVAVANAISLITQGQNQEIQMRQEIRGLISGDIRATNLLARMINAKLGGELKKNIILWKQQGTLLINLGNHLAGFKAGSADLASTWAALSTTFETIANRYLRNIFKPIYEDIIEMSLAFSRSLLDQKDETEDVTTETGSLHKIWLLIKSTLSTVKTLTEEFAAPLKFAARYSEDVLNAMLGMAIAAEMFAERTKESNEASKTLDQSFKKRAESIRKAWSGDAEGAKKALDESHKLLNKFGEEAGKTTAKSFLDEFRVRIHEAMGTFKSPVDKEDGDTPDLVTTKKDKWLDTRERLEAESEKNRLRIKYKGHELSLQLLELEKKKMIDIYGEKLSIEESFAIKRALILKRASEEEGAENTSKLAEQIRLRKEKEKLLKDEIKEKMLDAQRTFNANYAKIGKSSFDLERESLLSSVKSWEKYGFDKAKIAKLTSNKLEAIDKSETQQRINNIHSVASTMSDGFKMISEMGGKHSKEAFAMYKAFKITETIIATYSAAVKAYESMLTLGPAGPYLGAAAAAAVTSFGMAQVSMIKSAEPPSYDQGGISNAQGVYQTGNIAEAHIPLPSGGRIPVELKSEKQKPIIIIHMENPSFQDVETQRQVFAQIATVIARQVAPEAVVENYNNDGRVRSMVRGGA